ncbi:hypothetical protein FDG62_gp100 [Mycobacterium phage Nepal]|uniref:Uncharacterized protein n=1 Tax=Mycobacterium phage Nepal TaxID=2927981 RepID=I3WUD5_9CAUD|nr:hypothetical protein FDG62_gp100 [Mycobacterium phage Nepal]AFL46606.1 hypothetical protein NEPAL_100 [Mycobacterium phage Nepal]
MGGVGARLRVRAGEGRVGEGAGYAGWGAQTRSAEGVALPGGCVVDWVYSGRRGREGTRGARAPRGAPLPPRV